jgi:hypothetical protein
VTLILCRPSVSCKPNFPVKLIGMTDVTTIYYRQVDSFVFRLSLLLNSIIVLLMSLCREIKLFVSSIFKDTVSNLVSSDWMIKDNVLEGILKEMVVT